MSKRRSTPISAEMNARLFIEKEFERIKKPPAFQRSSKALDERQERQLAWLLAFSQIEMTKGSDWAALGNKIRSFALRLTGEGRVWPASVFEKGLSIVPGWGAVPTELPKVPGEREIREIHSQLRQLLDGLFPMGERKPVRLPIPCQIHHVYLSYGPKGIRRCYGAEWPDSLWLAILASLEKFGSRITHCEAPDCGRLFLRVRRQEYCSSECSQRVRSRRWYQAHQDDAQERRRNAYWRELSAEHPKVKQRSRSSKTKR